MRKANQPFGQHTWSHAFSEFRVPWLEHSGESLSVGRVYLEYRKPRRKVNSIHVSHLVTYQLHRIKLATFPLPLLTAQPAFLPWDTLPQNFKHEVQKMRTGGRWDMTSFEEGVNGEGKKQPIATFPKWLLFFPFSFLRFCSPKNFLFLVDSSVMLMQFIMRNNFSLSAFFWLAFIFT